MQIKFNNNTSLVLPAHNQHIYNSKCSADNGLIRWTIITLIFISVIDYCFAIKCYKCAVTVEKNRIQNVTIVTPMCSKFDESPEYIVDCPFSTMCHKTISTLYLQNEQKQDTITRGCAQQKDTTQVFRNRQWQQEHSVQEVYEEGCTEFKENNLAASGKIHCYCRGDLCNLASNIKPSSTPYTLTAFALLLVSQTF